MLISMEFEGVAEFYEQLLGMVTKTEVLDYQGQTFAIHLSHVGVNDVVRDIQYQDIYKRAKRWQWLEALMYWIAIANTHNVQ